MANDVDPARSPMALAPPTNPSSSTPTSPAKPNDNVPNNKVANASANIDRRRTQSATELSLQRPSSPTTSTASSPRNSLTESLSRSSSFLAAAFSGTFPTLSSPTNRQEPVHTITVVYTNPGPLYVDLYSRPDGCGAFVKSFRRKPDGAMGNAETSGAVRVNDMLYSINDLVVTEMAFASIIHAAKTTTFPCTLVFHSRLPPPSPATHSPPIAPSPAKGASTTSMSAMWTTKLNQMMGETSLKRSASFEKRSVSEAAPSPVRRPSASNPGTPPIHGSPADTPGKNKHWGESIERVKNSDGVKNLFRIMGGGTPRSRPEEDRDTVDGWFDHLELRLESPVDRGGGDGHLASPLVVATQSNGVRLLGVKDEELGEFSFKWYRKTPAQDLIPIKGVYGGRYFPSIDDFDARVSVRCQSVRFPDLLRVVEFSHPLKIDAAVKDMVDILLDAGAGSFSATLASNEFDSFQIKITGDHVTLQKISEDEEEGGVVASAAYHVHLQVLVDPTDQLRFTLKVQELGSMLGCREGDVCDVKRKQHLAGVSCFFLIAQNPQHRDIMTLLIRSFRARAIAKEEEDLAHRDELNLFVDPASSLHNGAVTGTSFHEPPSVSKPRRSIISPVNQADRRNANQQKPDVAEFPGTSSDRLADFFSLDTDITPPGWNTMANGSDMHQSSSRTAAFSSARNSFSAGTDGTERMNFMQDRLLAQDKEIAMLQEKLASMSVLVKSTEHEKTELVASLDMKDNRIESQNMRLFQLERANVQLSVSSRELQQMRARLTEEMKAHQTCQLQLAKALEDRAVVNQKEQSSQTDQQVEIPDSYRRTLDEAHAQVDAMSSAAKELRRQLATAQTKLQELEQEHLVVLGERNALRSRSTELAKELRTVVGPHRSLAEVQAQLEERSHLMTQLAIARAEAKRAVDEMQEYKEAYDNLLKQQQQTGAADKDKGATQRLVGQNAELQRLVHQLTDSLNEARDQLTATKKINGVLMAKMQEDNPEMRGSILSPPMSPMSTTSSVHEPRFSDDEDEEDDAHGEDDDDNEGGKFSLTLPHSAKTSTATSDDGDLGYH